MRNVRIISAIRHFEHGHKIKYTIVKSNTILISLTI